MTEETVPDLYRLAFMPGAFRCPVCDFRLSKTCINVALGEMGTREQDRESEPCPNDGTMLVHVTYREVLEEYAERLKQEFARLDKIREAMEALLQAPHYRRSASGEWSDGIQAALTAFDAERKR